MLKFLRCLLALLVTTVVHANEQTSSSESALTLTDVTFHVLTLPHTVVRDDFSPCAFTMKVKRLCSMLKSLGFKSILYANEGSVHDCDRMETIFSNEERQKLFGLDSEWKNGGWFHTDNAPGNKMFNDRVIESISKTKDDGQVNLLLASWGVGHQPIAEATGLTAIETGIGYVHAFARYRVYESYAYMHVMFDIDERFNYYHAVIPNCYYTHEFEGATRPPTILGRYLAFIARLTESKGIFIALQTLEFLPEDYTLHVAGQGDLTEFVPEGHPLYNRVVYHGVLPPKERNDLLIGAEALIAPSLYREPFGGIMVEAQMLGTPVITTDHAAMAETVWHGVTGYRCRTLRCFVAAAQQAHTLDRDVIARHANETYNCNQVQYQYEDYFQDVLNLWDPLGWGTLEGGPGHTLEQKKYYPLVESRTINTCESEFD